MERFMGQRTASTTSSRSFLSRSLTKREGSIDSRTDSKGPLGLNTLYQPLNVAIADLVFVHGLGGGSHSTWTKSDDPSLFWPKEWLPNDPGFQDVRIHTFGYDSNWEKESTLNLHDFAKSFLGSLQDCPSIPRATDAPLILIGHSMGGLVIKRAYVLAKQKDEFSSLARRIQAIFFLATPHRGADLAQLLTRILSLSSGSRPFVADLHRNSLATQSINDEFPQYSQDLQLYSFYETLPMSFGVGRSIVVDKDLATLGYANERTAYLNANHREVCKFTSPNNANYQTVRNAMASVIDNYRINATSVVREINSEQQRLLASFLGVAEAPEDDFMDIDALRMRGSCSWLLAKESFKEWQDSPNIQLYWISAKPATGKTVLSGTIIHHLKDLNRDLAFYFFDYRDKPKTLINSFLLSMAWQMAYIHPEIFQTVFEICEKDDQLCKSDYRTIWRKLFVEVILRVKFVGSQYWVIDALDECKAGSDLVPLLLKTTETSRIRILLTSRDRFESYRQVIHPRVKVISDEISEDDTKSDIKLYLQANMDQLPSIDDSTRQDMVDEILAKSAGCFLWVSLILQELRQVHTSFEIRKVLNDVPSDMNGLYFRILASMSAAPYGKKLAKAILTWTVCAVRPLTTSELYHALQIDMNDSIDSVERSIASSCGQLIYIDSQTRVQIIHQTARDYLIRADKSLEFAIDAKEGHKRLAMTSLKYLTGKEMQGPRHRRLSATNIVKQRCPFATYTCNSFFDHINHTPSTDKEILFMLAKLLNSSNVLSWIEYIAQHDNLDRLIQAGKAIKHFLQRRSRHLTPFGKEVTILDSWAMDLIRLVTKFGTYLSAHPSSIFHLIPPFCPPGTAPWKQFAASGRGIALLGISATEWDDCMSTIVNIGEQFSSIACCEQYFAIGTASGKISVHHAMTCQEIHVLQHQEPVKILRFGKNNILASTGLKAVRLWDLSSWEELWHYQIPQQCLTIAFMGEQELLLGALRNNELMVWDLPTGALRDSADWTFDLQGQNAHAYRRPVAAAICVESSLLAVIYRGQDILLWDLTRDSLHETYCKETGARHRDEKQKTGPGATGVIFSMGPNVGLLAASYSDGDLVLFDSVESTVKATTLANAQTLACSPDGLTLACGNSSGTIQLFDFETLKLLYRINSEEYSIQDLAFSGDSHRLLDIRGSQCRVWDPTVLMRQEVEDEDSDTVSVSTVAQELSMEASEDEVLITSIACHSKDGIVFCGKEDGSVYLYETKFGSQSHKITSHTEGTPILTLFLDETSLLLSSVDASSRVMVHRLLCDQGRWKASESLLDYRAGLAVDQVLSNDSSARLLVCTADTDRLWSIPGPLANSKVVTELSWEGREPYRWATHPLRSDILIFVHGNTTHLYEWQTLQRLTSAEGILLKGSILPELSIRNVVSCFNGSIIGTTFSESLKPHSESRLLLWSSYDFSETSTSAAPIPKYQSLADQVQTLIGEHGSKFVFLHSSGWVCSSNLQNPSVHDYTRHFFLPADWLCTNSDLMFGIVQDGDIIFVKRTEIAVIKRGLVNVELEDNAPDKRPSLLGVGRASLRVP